MIIYKCTNIVNGRIYIGQTTRSLNQRIHDHTYRAQNGSDLYFHRALQKYGIQSFKIEIIDTAEDINTLNEKEIYWIKTMNCVCPNGYNSNTGGLNFKASDETKRKIGLKSLGRIAWNKGLKRHAPKAKQPLEVLQ